MYIRVCVWYIMFVCLGVCVCECAYGTAVVRHYMQRHAQIVVLLYVYQRCNVGVGVCVHVCWCVLVTYHIFVQLLMMISIVLLSIATTGGLTLP